MKAEDWIKVTDRLPEDDHQLCLVLTKKGIVLLTRWNNTVRVFEVIGTEIGYYKGALSHWIPIVLPKEED